MRKSVEAGVEKIAVELSENGFLLENGYGVFEDESREEAFLGACAVEAGEAAAGTSWLKTNAWSFSYYSVQVIES